MRGFFLGFPGYRDQSALSFLKGRSSRFLQFLCLFNHVEVKFFILWVSGSVFGFIWYYKASGFLNILWLLPWILSFLWWRFFFLLFSVTFVSDVCLSIYYTCFLLCLLLVCWVRENFSGGPGHIFPVWDSVVWSAGPVQFIWMLAWSGWRDCTGFFFSGSVVVGAVRLKWWGGGLAFFLFSLFCC